MRGWLREGSPVQRLLIGVASWLYERVFHQKLSEEGKRFFENLSYVAVGYGLATVGYFVFQILAGRELGAAEYGKFALVESVAMFLYLPMNLGVSTAMVKYNAEEESRERQREIISTTYLQILALSAIFIPVFVLLASPLSRLFGVSRELFLLAILFAFLYILYFQATNTLRGLHKLKALPFFQILYGVALVPFLFFFLYASGHSYKAATLALFLAYLVYAGAILLAIRGYLTFRWNRAWAGVLTRYGLLAVAGALAAVIYSNMDKILINRYLAAQDVGVYRVYWVASIGSFSFFLILFDIVYFPTASRLKDKAVLLSRIDRLLPYILFLGLPAILIWELIVLKLFGGEYTFDLRLMLFFALTSVLVMFYALYDRTYSSEGVRGMKVVALATVLVAVCDVALNFLLIPRYDLYGAIAAMFVAFAVGIGVLFWLRRHIL